MHLIAARGQMALFRFKFLLLAPVIQGLLYDAAVSEVAAIGEILVKFFVQFMF